MPPIKNTQTIIWDWNGTLLNDLELCIDSMNPLLRERNLPLLTPAVYREVFTFPVKVYYQKIGFNFEQEPFNIPALQFMDNYHNKLPGVKLFEAAKETLSYFQKKGLRQFVLSAMEQESLEKLIADFGIRSYFEAIAGIENHFAAGKIHRGLWLMDTFKLSAENVLLIGDTLHDKEVADHLACKCILVAHGHQSHKRLMVNRNVVVNNLVELQEFI